MTADAALQAFEQELSRLFPADSDGALALRHPLAALRSLVDAGEGAQGRPLLDAIEDILESLMCRAGWPGGAR